MRELALGRDRVELLLAIIRSADRAETKLVAAKTSSAQKGADFQRLAAELLHPTVHPLLSSLPLERECARHTLEQRYRLSAEFLDNTKKAHGRSTTR